MDSPRDMHDGWEKSGEVGQEVYGAGNAFGILPRHYMQVPGEDFMVFVDYPTTDFKTKKGKPVSFFIKGDERLTCRLVLVAKGKKKLPNFTVTINGNEAIKGTKRKDGNIEYLVNGNQVINITW